MGTIMADILPTDIIASVLSLLPVKSLLRFRCVCKHWCSVIHDPNFISLHKVAQQNKNETIYLINQHIICSKDKIYMGNLFSRWNKSAGRKDFNHLRRDVPLCRPPNRCVFYGSYHGLVCFGEYHYDRPYKFVLNVWNPSINRLKKIHSDADYTVAGHLCGFGPYKGTNGADDYKVVKLTFTNERYNNTRVDVYTFRANSWRRIGYVDDIRLWTQRDHSVIFNGALHWLGSVKAYRPVVLCFDLQTDAFWEILVPECLAYVGITMFGHVGYFQESLSLVLDYCRRGTMDIWVMKEYGVVDSWTRLFSVALYHDPQLPPYDTVLKYIGDYGAMLRCTLWGGGHGLAMIDFNTGEFVLLESKQLKEGCYYKFQDLIDYTESLLLINESES